MSEYRIKWNKEDKFYIHQDMVSLYPPWLYGFTYQITNYQQPLEEKELVLDEVPAPDFAGMLGIEKLIPEIVIARRPKADAAIHTACW